MARYNEMSSEYDDDGPVALEDRKLSKVEEATLILEKEIQELGEHISELERRLSSVVNDYPRPESSEGMTENVKKPVGESPLLSNLQSLRVDLNRQVMRIIAIFRRLDI